MHQLHGAGGWLVEAGDAIEHRGLAGAVRPDQRSNPAPTGAKRQIVDRDDAASTNFPKYPIDI
jgi:hypothetical protein